MVSFLSITSYSTYYIEEFPMYFPLCFMVLLKQLRRLYTGGFIFQVPPVSNYSTCCADHVPTRSVQQPRVYASVHQPLAYASGALMKH